MSLEKCPFLFKRQHDIFATNFSIDDFVTYNKLTDASVRLTFLQNECGFSLFFLLYHCFNSHMLKTIYSYFQCQIHIKFSNTLSDINLVPKKQTAINEGNLIVAD